MPVPTTCSSVTASWDERCALFFLPSMLCWLRRRRVPPSRAADSSHRKQRGTLFVSIPITSDLIAFRGVLAAPHTSGFAPARLPSAPGPMHSKSGSSSSAARIRLPLVLQVVIQAQVRHGPDLQQPDRLSGPTHPRPTLRGLPFVVQIIFIGLTTFSTPRWRISPGPPWRRPSIRSLSPAGQTTPGPA